MNNVTQNSILGKEVKKYMKYVNKERGTTLFLDNKLFRRVATNWMK